MVPDVDFSVLARRPSLRARLQAVWGSNTWVWSTTLGVLMVLVPLVVVALADGARSDGGALACLGMLAAAGLYVVAMVLHAVAGDAALADLARSADLVLTQGSAATHYAGSRFDGDLLVHRSVRTRDEGFLEVGDTHRLGARVAGTQGATDVFLRAGLAGPVRPGSTDAPVVDPELAQRLTRWAGPYAVEWGERELTLHGTRSLDPREPDRVREGFALADQLRRRADELVVATPAELETATTSGIPVPVLPRRETPTGRSSRPLVVIGGLLAFLTIGPLVGALVLSTAEDAIGGRSELFPVVVGLLVTGAVAICGALVRFVTAPRRSRAAAQPGSGSHTRSSSGTPSGDQT